jgi:tetratricopeptide (TPR) repeat protein
VLGTLNINKLVTLTILTEEATFLGIMLRVALLAIVLSSSVALAGEKNYLCFYTIGQKAIDACSAGLKAPGLKKPEIHALLQQRGNHLMEIFDHKKAASDFEGAIATGFATAADYRNLGISLWWLDELKKARAALDEALKRDANNLSYKMDIAELMSAMKEYEASLALAQDVLATDTFNPAYLLVVAQQLNILRRNVEAIPLLRKASVYDRENPRIWWELGYALGKAMQYPEAIEALDKALNYDVKNAEIYVSRAGLHLDMGIPEAALGDYDKALSIKVDRWWFLDRAGTNIDLKRYEDAQKDIDAARRSDIPEERALILEGRIALARGETLAAAAKFNAAITKNPDDVAGYYWRGRIRTDLKNYKGAIADYEISLKQWADDEYTWASLGDAQFDEGLYRKALESFSRATAISPNYAYAFERQSLAYQYLGQWTNAELAADRAIAADNTRPMAYYRKAQAARQSRTPIRALDAISTYIKMVPDKSWGYLERARTHIVLQNMTSALHEIEKAKSLNPKIAEIPAVEAWRLSEMGNHQAALEVLQAAVERNPKDGWQYHDRGWELLSLGKPVQGLADCEEAAKLLPLNASPLRCQAHMLLRMGRRADARERLQAAISRDPDAGAPYYDLGKLEFEERNYESVIAHMSNAIERESTVDHALVYRADAYQATGLPNAAKRDYEQALKTAGKDLADYVGRRMNGLQGHFDHNFKTEYPQRKRANK